MTFSEKKVVDLIKKEFVPVWQSVAPITVSTYKLDEEREVRGIVNGEIALYFCRPDGVAFDVLPALQSPAQTLAAMKRALTLYRDSDGAKNWQKVVGYHSRRYQLLTTAKQSEIDAGEKGLRMRAQRIDDAGDDGSKDLRVAIFSKSLIQSAAERFVTVEPGGMHLYKSRVHEKFFKIPKKSPNATRAERLNHYPKLTPEGWKKIIFEEVLEMPLKSHTAIYDTSSIAPFTIIEE